jgi:ABC-type antimicrobial peptide transport system permease subunit
MNDIVVAVTAPMALNMWLMTTFAVIALMVALVGLYAITAHSVEQRRHELGVRLALGADPSQLRNSVIRQCMHSAGIGIAVGVVAAAAFGSVLRSFLFGVTVHDPATFLAIPLLLSSAALIGAWIPARRAARIDPLIALRVD